MADEEIVPSGSQVGGEKIIKETSYTSAGSAGGGSLVSNIPIADDEILQQLKDLDTEARQRATKIQSMRDSIIKYQEVEHMTDEIAEKLNNKQNDLLEELQEFDRITVEIQRLIGLAESSGLLTISAEAIPLAEPPAEPQMEKKPRVIIGPTVKELGFLASGTSGTIAEYLTDRAPKLLTARFRDGVPQVILLDSPKKGGASQPPKIEGMDALSHKYLPSRAGSQMVPSKRSAAAPSKYPPSAVQARPSSINIGHILQGKLQCLQAEIEQLKDENGRLNDLIVQLVQENLQGSCPAAPCSTSNSLCPAHLVQQMDKLEQELQELQQLLACERVELELEKVKQIKPSCNKIPCSMLPPCLSRPCK